MIGSGIILAFMALATGAVGRYGMNHAEELIGMMNDADTRERRYRSIRNGSVATFVVGVVLGLAAVASIVIGVAEL